MTNSNLGPISHYYWDTVTYWLKIANFSHPPLSFSALTWGDPFRIYEKALWILKLESSRQPMVKTGDPSLHRFWLIHPCDGQTDRQTELRWLRHAKAIGAFGHRNFTSPIPMLRQRKQIMFLHQSSKNKPMTAYRTFSCTWHFYNLLILSVNQ